MGEIKAKIDELAGIVAEFGLEKAKLQGEDWCVEMAHEPPGRKLAVAQNPGAEAPAPRQKRQPAAPPQPQAPAGVPVTSPMTGIFYAASSPGSPPFAKLGDVVEQGQVVALIEAMKVFNEITAPVSGTVTKVAAENAQLVQPGEPLLYIG